MAYIIAYCTNGENDQQMILDLKLQNFWVKHQTTESSEIIKYEYSTSDSGWNATFAYDYQSFSGAAGLSWIYFRL